MDYTVGAKGQIVIAKEIRERMGVRPGWTALQRHVDDHLEVRFVPPEHNRSLKGSLSEFVRRSVAPGEEWDRAIEAAWRRRSDDSPASSDDSGTEGQTRGVGEGEA